MKKNVTKKRRRSFLDRPDGRYLRSLTTMAKLVPFIMPTRVDSSVYFQDSVEMDAINEFIRKKRKEGMPGFGAMHVLMSAYLRTTCQFPGINRFISGQRIYARDNVEINIGVKKTMKLNSPENMMKFIFERDVTVDDVYNELQKSINEYKLREDDGDDELFSTIDLMCKIPRPLLRFAVNLIKFLDYHGILGKKLLRISPFHGSAFFTSMASLGIPPVFHHLYDIGNISLFIAFSGIRHEKILQPDNTSVTKRFLDFTIVCDERICDGHYFATAFKSMKNLLENPSLLEMKPEAVVEDVD